MSGLCRARYNGKPIGTPVDPCDRNQGHREPHRSYLPIVDNVLFWTDPPTDAVCAHGTALDVHCCNCHGGFLFDSGACVCHIEAT